ncbi:unnamed protein product [marine sediment metagenome]|uniref:Uncharacterized protein n=1 Tax=marine sediment metagenome TaxID=412755 RepID=X1F7P5_9ZZZZ
MICQMEGCGKEMTKEGSGFRCIPCRYWVRNPELKMITPKYKMVPPKYLE